jgi:hypothetical protein
MAKLVYWVASQDKDGSCYNIVAKTKKSCLEKIASTKAWWGPSAYDAPVRREIHYKDAFDLFDKATDECGGRS